MVDNIPSSQERIPTADITESDIVALKKTLKGNPLLPMNVCAQLALELHIPQIDFDAASDSPEAEREAVEDLAFAVGQTAASYAVRLDEVLKTPGAEWAIPLPATDFADALVVVEQKFPGISKSLVGNVDG